MKPLIIYHDNCADGFTAAWVAHRFFKGECELYPAQYQEPPPDVTGRDVFVLDFSYPRLTLKDMLSKAAGMLVLDHHKTAREDLEGLACAHFDMSESGASLAWDYFFPGEPRPWIVDYVRDRDLWLWELPDSKAVSAFLGTVEPTIENWTGVDQGMLGSKNSRGVPMGYVEAGRAVLAYIDQKVRKACERAVVSVLVQDGTVGATDCATLNCTGEISEVGNALALKHPCAAMWFETETGEIVYSLRSSAENPDHVDVSVIARWFGGGGHKHAAGFKVPRPVHRRQV